MNKQVGPSPIISSFSLPYSTSTDNPLHLHHQPHPITSSNTVTTQFGFSLGNTITNLQHRPTPRQWVIFLLSTTTLSPFLTPTTPVIVQLFFPSFGDAMIASSNAGQPFPATLPTTNPNTTTTNRTTLVSSTRRKRQVSLQSPSTNLLVTIHAIHEQCRVN